MGRPAIADGHSLLIGEAHIDVTKACSGLRIFVAVMALAYACAFITPCRWWKRIVLLFSALPVAILANTLRVSALAIMHEQAPSDTVILIGHDLAGWITIPIAACFFAGLLWYLDKLVRTAETIDSGSLLRWQSESTRKSYRPVAKTPLGDVTP